MTAISWSASRARPSSWLGVRRVRWPPASSIPGTATPPEAAEAPPRLRPRPSRYEPDDGAPPMWCPTAAGRHRGRPTAGSSASSLTNADGKVVAGASSTATAPSFTVTEPLGYGGDYTLGRLGGRAATARRSRVRGQLHHRQPRRPRSTALFQLADGQDGRGGRADHPAVRRLDPRRRPRGGREGAEGHHHPGRSRAAGPGCPTRSAARACTGAPRTTTRPAPRCTSTRSCTACRSATDAVRRRRTPRWTSRSAGARWSRPRRRRTASRCSTARAR